MWPASTLPWVTPTALTTATRSSRRARRSRWSWRSRRSRSRPRRSRSSSSSAWEADEDSVPSSQPTMSSKQAREAPKPSPPGPLTDGPGPGPGAPPAPPGPPRPPLQACPLRPVATDGGPHPRHLAGRQHHESGPACFGVGEHHRLVQRLAAGAAARRLATAPAVHHHRTAHRLLGCPLPPGHPHHDAAHLPGAHSQMMRRWAAGVVDVKPARLKGGELPPGQIRCREAIRRTPPRSLQGSRTRIGWPTRQRFPRPCSRRQRPPTPSGP